MAKIRQFQLPPELAEALHRAMTRIPDAVVVEWAREWMPGGFTKAKLIRDRLGCLVRSAGVVDSGLLFMLRYWLPGRRAVESLSAPALRKMFPSFAVLLGQEKLLLSLLVDEREEVHKLGVEQAAHPPPPVTEQAKEDAEFMIREFLEVGVLEGTGITFDPGEALEEALLPETPLPPIPGLDKFLQEELLRTKKELADKEKTIERLKRQSEEDRSKHKAKARELAEKHEQEKARWLTEQQNTKTKREESQREIQALQEQLAQLTRRQDQVISTRVEEQTSLLLRKWLAAPIETEQFLEQGKPRADDLLARAEHALQAQARQDRYTGNRLELEARLARLQAARDRLSTAAGTAICPVHEVSDALREIEVETARAQKMLHGAWPPDPVAEKVLVQINQSSAWDEVRHFSALLQQLTDLRILEREERRRLYDALHRKFSLLEEREKSRDSERGDNGWSLRNALFRNLPTVVLLDGHNILFGLEDVFRAEYEQGHPRRKARERLVQIIQTLVASRPSVQVNLCFDGPAPTRIDVSPNLKVLYSGGSGEHRADQLITSQLEIKSLENMDQKMFVVTDDRELRREALKAGAKYVPVDLFAVLLADFRCL